MTAAEAAAFGQTPDAALSIRRRERDDHAKETHRPVGALDRPKRLARRR